MIIFLSELMVERKSNETPFDSILFKLISDLTLLLVISRSFSCLMGSLKDSTMILSKLIWVELLLGVIDTIGASRS